MKTQAMVYIIFGLALVVLFAIIVVHYYSRNRHDKVEHAKYTMLDDDE